MAIWRQRIALIALYLILLVVLLGNFVFAGEADDTAGGGGAAVHQMLMLLATGMAIVAINPLHRPQKMFAVPLGIALTLLWCWLSISWALVPSIALRRIVLATIAIWSVFALVRELGYAASLRVARHTLLATLIVCYLVVLISPETGIQKAVVVSQLADGTGWRGAMVDKNSAGSFCAITFLFFFFDNAGSRSRYLISLAALVFLGLSVSKTSIGVVVLALAVGWIVRKHSASLRFLLIPIAAIVVALFAIEWFQIQTYLGRMLDQPDAFTGRSQIWRAMTSFIRDHPMFGAGYGSFWAIGPQSPILVYTNQDWIKKIYQGHNGYIDIWAQTGAIGMVLAAFTFFLLPMFRIAMGGVADRSRAALLTAVIFFCFGNNFTESTLLNRDHFLYIFLVLALALHGVSGEEPRRLIRRVRARVRWVPRAG